MQEAWFFYAASHIQAGQAALLAGKSEEALSSFQESARLDQYNLAAFGGIAESLSRLGRGKESQQTYAHLFYLTGAKAGDLGSLGGQLFSHGWYHVALTLWEEAEKADPMDAIWPANQAAALKMLGRSAQARV